MGFTETVPESDIVKHRGGINDGFATVTKRLTMMMAEYIEDDIGQHSADTAYQAGVTAGMREALQAVHKRWQEVRAAPPEPHLDNMPGL